MVIKLDVSKLDSRTVECIARQTDDISVLTQLAMSDDADVVISVIENPETTKEIRDAICDKWINREKNKQVMEVLVECPLSADAIHKIVKQMSIKAPWVCKALVLQEDISAEDLQCIFDNVTAGDLAKGLVMDILSNMISNEYMSESLVQKLVDYSPETASKIAKRYSRFLRVDFSKGQTE